MALYILTKRVALGGGSSPLRIEGAADAKKNRTVQFRTLEVYISMSQIMDPQWQKGFTTGNF